MRCKAKQEEDPQPRSYAEMKTGPTGTVHRSFEAAAHDYNLLAGMDEYTVMFREEVATRSYSPAQLQQLFVLCLTADSEFAGSTLWDEF